MDDRITWRIAAKGCLNLSPSEANEKSIGRCKYERGEWVDFWWMESEFPIASHSPEFLILAKCKVTSRINKIASQWNFNVKGSRKESTSDVCFITDRICIEKLKSHIFLFIAIQVKKKFHCRWNYEESFITKTNKFPL